MRFRPRDAGVRSPEALVGQASYELDRSRTRLTIASAVAIAAPGEASFRPALASAARRSGDHRSSVATDDRCDGDVASSAAPHSTAYRALPSSWPGNGSNASTGRP